MEESVKNIKDSANPRVNSLMTTQSDYYETQYVQVTKVFNTGSYNDFWSETRVVMQVKLHVYWRSTGIYQKFGAVLSSGASANGSDPSTFQTIAISTPITNETEKANSIYLMLSGNVETVIPSSLGFSAEIAGFGISSSIGNSITYRKYVQINYTFNSNFPLN